VVYLVSSESEADCLNWSSELSVENPIGADIKSDLIARYASSPDVMNVENGLVYNHDLALHRFVFDYVVENSELWSKGGITTRSWEPTLPVALWQGDQIGGIPARAFWRGASPKDTIEVPMNALPALALRCAWVFTGLDEDNDSSLRLNLEAEAKNTAGKKKRRKGLGGETKRGLEDVLQDLGLSQRTKWDARTIPLMLVLPEKMTDKWIGIAVGEPMGSPKRSRLPGSASLEQCEVTLSKKEPSCKLTLTWLEPQQ